MSRAGWLKALPLFGFSAVEISVAFIRALVLTRFLGPYEFGFASAISLAFATAILVTDLAIYRFVLSTRRTEFSEVMASAHAIMIVRGILIALCILIVAYPLACTLSNCAGWTSFAWLAPIMVIASLEHLEMRVGERDYRYWPQFVASIVSHGLGLIALIWTAYTTKSHFAFLAYLFVQVSAFVLLSHLLAANRYSVQFRSPYCRKILAFGLPLIANGVALAIIGQGDRFMVGALLGLEILAAYTVLFLAATLPISALLRILNPVLFAGLHNARDKSSQLNSRLQLFSRGIPVLAGCYALGVIGFLQIILPIVFGPQYTASNNVAALLSLIVFFRIARAEPHTSILLFTHKTGKLAAANMSLVVGLITATALVLFYRSIESVLIGSLLGEVTGLCVTIYMTRKTLKRVRADYYASLSVMLSIVLTVCIVAIDSPFTNDLFMRSAIISALLLLVLLGAAMFLSPLYRKAYKAGTLEISAPGISNLSSGLADGSDTSWH